MSPGIVAIAVEATAARRALETTSQPSYHYVVAWFGLGQHPGTNLREHSRDFVTTQERIRRGVDP